MTSVSGAPVLALKTRNASLTDSTTWPPPAHSAWSGGSRLNWLPPLVSRWSRWLIPSNEDATRGPARLTLSAWTVFSGALAVALPCARTPCWRERLRFGPAARFLVARCARATASPPALSAPSRASGPKARGISVEMAAGAPLPFGLGLNAALPVASGGELGPRLGARHAGRSYSVSAGLSESWPIKTANGRGKIADDCQLICVWIRSVVRWLRLSTGIQDALIIAGNRRGVRL